MECRSAKVYEILTNDVDVILESLQEMSGDDTNHFPRTRNVRQLEGSNIEGTLWIPGPDTIHIPCGFLFNTSTRKVYLLGTAEARDAAYLILNNLPGLEDNIREMGMTNRQLVDDIRGKLREQDNRNFIKKMNLTFSVGGIPYHNNTNLYKLDYELVRNTCGSTHDSFDVFVDEALIIKVRFGIFRFFNIDRRGKRDKPASMNIRTNFTISFYTNIDSTDWYEMLDYLVREF